MEETAYKRCVPNGTLASQEFLRLPRQAARHYLVGPCSR
jgi:hypothetical protein